jgi:hypothetical protein
VTLENSPSWKQLYLATLRMSEKDKLTELVQSAELAMFHRLKQLTNSPEHRDERNQIRWALLDLLAIKTYKLRWPALLHGKSYCYQDRPAAHPPMKH